MKRRAARKPSQARWVFEQATLQTHAHCSETLGARTKCIEQQLEFEWPLFTLFTRRYMLGSLFVVRWVSRFRLRRARALEGRGDNYYVRLLAQFHAYWGVTGVLSATDLDAREERLQRRDHRREKYEEWVKEVPPGGNLYRMPREQRKRSTYLIGKDIRAATKASYEEGWCMWTAWDVMERPNDEGWRNAWGGMFESWKAAGRPDPREYAWARPPDS